MKHFQLITVIRPGDPSRVGKPEKKPIPSLKPWATTSAATCGETANIGSSYKNHLQAQFKNRKKSRSHSGQLRKIKLKKIPTTQNHRNYYSYSYATYMRLSRIKRRGTELKKYFYHFLEYYFLHRYRQQNTPHIHFKYKLKHLIANM